ncbi:hypothetical protein [Methylocystis sp.]|jgi:hypothetical protein|uniref:hypothetical protein n=1 Tax=Methylocystis sp. TaxID=1911079 RepID=UPI002735F2AA|nr:hypothetical protein [Methylocystis sp.]MDP3553070.1 hypothetical protein [Methylocystis sp.]
MQAIEIDFQWGVFADYRAEPERTFSPEARATTLLGSGSLGPTLAGEGQYLKTRPIDEFPDLYLKIATAEPTAPGHKDFAKTFGLLKDTNRESLWEFQRGVEQMKKLVHQVENRANWPIKDGHYLPYEIRRSFTLQFKPNLKSSSMTLSVIPINLWVAASLQCILSSASGTQIKSCKACGKPFEVGGASGARSHKETCSDKCRFEYSKRKSK